MVSRPGVKAEAPTVTAPPSRGEGISCCNNVAVRFWRRAVGGVSRRLGRPELLAAVDPIARRTQREELAINVVLAATLRSDSSYVDVGANRGQILREAVRVAPAGRHVAFEPIPSLAAELARAFPQVECRQLALGARDEVARFCHYTQLDGWSGLRPSPQVSDQTGRPEFITVRVSTLDAQLPDVHPQTIKIDVEGAELAVLEGGRGLLARARPFVIFEHVAQAAAPYGGAPDAVWDLLSDLGYEIFAVTGAGPFTRAAFARGADVVNWLATPGARSRVPAAGAAA